jgi:hypothetical protein
LRLAKEMVYEANGFVEKPGKMFPERAAYFHATNTFIVSMISVLHV